MAATALILAGAETVFPAVLGKAVDAVTRNAAPRTWVLWTGLLVTLLIGTDAIDDLASGAVTATSTAWLRTILTRRLVRLNPVTKRFPNGDLVNRVVGNTADVGGIGSVLVRAASNIVPVVGGTVALALINTWLLFTFLCGLPIALLIVRTFSRDASEAAASYLQQQGRIAASLSEALSGSRTIAAAGTQGREFDRIIEPLPHLHAAGMATWSAQARILAKDALLVPLLEVAVLAVAGVQLAHGTITPGEMLAASQYVVLAAGFSVAVGTVQQLAQSRAAASRVAEVLDDPPMVYGKRRLPKGDGHIQIKGVTVLSGDAAALDGIDLNIPAGSLAAVVGASGSGKSMLAAVVGRLVDPDEGEVLLDGVALADLSHKALRKAITYGFEKPALFGTTIKDAIAFGLRHPTMREIEDGARAARADLFIERMTAGYHTPLPDAAMSGGERQRLGLARALAHPGRVLVLDDVASRVDTVTQHEITEALTGQQFARTRIVVAHRASTAARADFVVWLERGRVRGTGQHQVLWIDRDYRRLFQPARYGRRTRIGRQVIGTTS